MHFEQAPPRSWDQFEELCADTFQQEWQDSTLVRHGRAGQAQYGVDIIGTDGAIWPVGIQCKKKTLWPVAKVTIKELNVEVEKAKKFEPKLKTFYLVSTAPDDQALQKHARLITERHKKAGLFAVAVIGWGELVRRATRHQQVAAKHFGSYSSGPAAPLLATWRTSGGKLLLDDRELQIAIRELIHDFADYPSGRIVVRQQESEDLLIRIKQLRAAKRQSLDGREAVLKLRDQMKILRDSESAIVAGIKLLCAHKDLRDLTGVVWKPHAPLLIRSFVEYEINPNRSVVTDMQKIRLQPPGFKDDPISIFVSSQEILDIWAHQNKLKQKHPSLATDKISELPDSVQFRHAVPAVIRKILFNVAEGAAIENMIERKWLNMFDWRFEIR